MVLFKRPLPGEICPGLSIESLWIFSNHVLEQRLIDMARHRLGPEQAPASAAILTTPVVVVTIAAEISVVVLVLIEQLGHEAAFPGFVLLSEIEYYYMGRSGLSTWKYQFSYDH